MGVFKHLMGIIDFVKKLIKHKLENGWSISIDLPSGYTVPEEERTKWKSKKPH